MTRTSRGDGRISDELGDQASKIGADQPSVIGVETGVLTRIDAQVKQADPDRWLASRFAPARARHRLIALYAFADELARAVWVTSEPMIADIRLAWWREAVDEVLGAAALDDVRRHDVVQALAMAQCVRDGAGGVRDGLHALIDARAMHVDHGGYADFDAILAHVDGTAGALCSIAATVCATGDASDIPTIDVSAINAVARSIGRAWGLVGLARSFSALAGKRLLPVAADSLVKWDISADALAQARDPDQGRRTCAVLLDAAQEAYTQAKQEIKHLPGQTLPTSLWPALGYGALVPAYVKSMRHPDHDPWTQGGNVSLLGRQMRLTLASLRGRV